jgi:hypothetical protein
MSAYADKKSRSRRWTTGFSPGGAISIAYLKSIASSFYFKQARLTPSQKQVHYRVYIKY